VRKTLIPLLALMLIVPSAFAVPNLQLYIPGATYNTTTETWVTPLKDFDVWVEAGNLNKGDIYNIYLTAALSPSQAALDGALSITNLQNSVTANFNASDYWHGSPPPGVNALPGHGIFPTTYTEMLVTNQTSKPWVDVYDNVDGGGPTPGNIFKFHVHSTYDFVHFDAYGYYKDVDGRFIFAPFSHDAESGGRPPVPEPATMLLFGLGAAGTGIIRKIKK